MASAVVPGCCDDNQQLEFKPITEGMCEAGGGQVELEGCPMDTIPLLPLVGGGLCCVSSLLLTPTQCSAVGGRAISDPGDGSLEECPRGSRRISAILGFVEGGYCCTL